MVEDKTYWTNEHGYRMWYHKYDINITAHRHYHWVDRITFINEGGPLRYDKRYGGNDYIYNPSSRVYIKTEKTYTEFQNELDNWIPIKDYYQYTATKLMFFYDCKNFNL